MVRRKTPNRRTTHSQPSASGWGRPYWLEGAELLLGTEFGKTLVKAIIIEMAEAVLRPSKPLSVKSDPSTVEQSGLISRVFESL